jgi:hypothetical protein
MPLFQKIVDRLITRAQRTPYTHLVGYMERFWVMNPYASGTYEKKRSWLPSVRIHHILRSDDDRAFHDHPWPYLTVVLRGGYWEIRPTYDDSGLYMGNERVWHGPGSILWRPANSWHRLELPEGETAWTLFTTGRHQQTWGFMRKPDVKMPYKEYLAEASTLTAVQANYQERRTWSSRQWADHVGAWEDGRDCVCFGSWMAVRAMLLQFQATTAYAFTLEREALPKSSMVLTPQQCMSLDFAAATMDSLGINQCSEELRAIIRASKQATGELKGGKRE